MSIFTTYNVIILTETWLNDSFFDSELVCENWVLFRMDRDYEGLGLTRGGGVLIAIHKSIPCSSVDLVLDRTIEQTWAKIVTENLSLFIGVAYVPPSSPLDVYESNLRQIEAIINHMKFQDNCLLLGDWNLKVDWKVDDEIPGLLLPRFPQNYSSSLDHEDNFISIEYSILKFLLSKGFVQLNSNLNSIGNILDLVFFNELSDKISIRPASSSESRFKNSIHHTALDISIEMQLPPHEEPIISYKLDFKRADYSNIAFELSSIDWTLLDVMDTDMAVDYFYCKLSDLFDKYVPRRQNKNFNRYPWLDRDLRHLRNVRDRSKNSPQYNDLCTQFNEKSKLAYEQYIQNLGEEIIYNPHSFFDYIKSQKNTDGFQSSLKRDGVFSSDSNVIANMFANHFSSVYQSPINSTSFRLEQSITYDSLDNITLSEEEVLDELISLDPKKVCWS